MTTIPLTVLDNFFDNPNTIRDYALSLEYKSDEENYPGKRSKPLHILNTDLFHYTNNKVLSLFFTDYKEVRYEVYASFQIIEKHPGEGWVHQDPNLFTFIIYLHESNPNINCGTSLWSLNSNVICPIKNEFERSYFNDKRTAHHLHSKYDKEAVNSFNRNFTKEISIPDKYNRLVAFSSELFHSANFYDNNLSPRLTLIGFVNNVSNNSLPVIRSKQTQLF